MIVAVQQVGNNVRILNEKGLTLFMKCGECVGYTSESVSIKYNSKIWTYDSSGRTLFGK